MGEGNQKLVRVERVCPSPFVRCQNCWGVRKSGERGVKACQKPKQTLFNSKVNKYIQITNTIDLIDEATKK